MFSEWLGWGLFFQFVKKSTSKPNLKRWDLKNGQPDHNKTIKKIKQIKRWAIEWNIQSKMNKTIQAFLGLFILPN